MDLKSRPGVSPLLENEMARVCGWLKATAKPSKVPYRRGRVVRKSRRTLCSSPINTVAREASWGPVSYAFLIEGLPMYSNETLCTNG